MADLNYYFGHWQRDAEQVAWVPPAGTVGLIDWGSLNDCALSPSAIDQRGIGIFCTPRGLVLPSEYTRLDSGDCREIKVTAYHVDIVEAVLGVRIDAIGMTLAQACSELFATGDPTGLERWKPQTPDRDLNYPIHLGGHSTIWNRRFEVTADKTWNKLRDLLRYDLQRHDDECKAEARALKDAAKELRKQKKTKDADACDARAAKVEFHAEKVLDAMCRKYRCLPSELSTTIRRGKASTTISDDFTRADGDTIGNQLTWTETSGDWDTDANRAKTGPYGDYIDCRAESDLSSSDHLSQVVLSSSLAIGGPCVRFSSAARTYYGFRPMFSHTTNQHIGKWVAGSATWLGSVNYAAASGSTFKTDATGSTITGYENGTQKVQTTDTAITGNLRTGLLAYTGFSYAMYADDFYATDGIAEGHPAIKRFGGVPFAAANRGVW